MIRFIPKTQDEGILGSQMPCDSFGVIVSSDDFCSNIGRLIYRTCTYSPEYLFQLIGCNLHIFKENGSKFRVRPVDVEIKEV